jgi:hypothetical protein
VSSRLWIGCNEELLESARWPSGDFPGTGVAADVPGATAGDDEESEGGAPFWFILRFFSVGW